MNRQTILASVHRQLRESLAETGEVRPLGEIVPRVANEIRSGSHSMTATAPSVISIEKVAAFVDGYLENAEADVICEAVMVDNSVLAEIISAVRATQDPLDQLPPLSTSLTAQLLAMSAAIPTENESEIDPMDSGLAEIRVETSRPHEEREARRGNGPKRGKGVRIAAVLVAIAATIVAAIVLSGRLGDELPNQDMVVHTDADPNDQGAIQPDAIPELGPDLPETQPASDPIQDIVENPSTTPQVEEMTPDSGVPDSDPAIVTTENPKPDGQDVATEKMPMPPNINPLIDPDPIKIPNEAPQLADLRWTKVSGLLAQRTQPSEATGSSRAQGWKRIQEGSPSSSTKAKTVALRTLPFSKASGELGTGGRVVIAGDTGLLITRGGADASAEVNLMYGSIAMLDLAKGTIIKVQQAGQTIATLHWQSQASAVLLRQTAGLQIQVDGGEIEINDTPVREQSVQVANDAKTIETIRAPKRLPRWITQPDDSTAADRLILAQIADTDDLTASLNRRIGALASQPTLRRDDARILAKLASWQAAMAGNGVYRLAGSRVPAVRLAAMQRLAQLPENDPRYVHTWNAIDRSLNNAQRANQIRAWFRLLRGGARPNAAQLEQMINGLSTRDFAGRVLCDFMLRQYVRNPPPFDPSWNGQTLQRAVNVYRERAGLPADRVRPNAAAAGNR